MADSFHPEETKGAFGEKDPLSITDRRHWVRRAETGEKEDGKAEAPPSKLPTYLEQLEQRLREKDERLKAFMAEQQAENEAFRERVSRQAERRAVAAKGEVIEPILSALDDLLASGRVGLQGGMTRLPSSKGSSSSRKPFSPPFDFRG